MSNWSPPPIWPRTPRRRQGIWNYPRPHRTGIRAWIPSWRFVVGTLLTGTSLVGGVVAAAWMNISVPPELDSVDFETTTVYYADGKKLGQFAAQDRTLVSLKDLPSHVPDAIIASEDQSFRSHPGINPRAIARAVLNNVTGGAQQGASTLTQQYVENYYVGVGDTTYADEFREAILALKVTQEQSKDQVLEGYLNSIYLGRGAYGVDAASKAYFGHPATEMTISQSAFLAGIIPNPTYWDPRQGEAAQAQAESRWNRTLDFMVETGAITQEDRAAAKYPELVKYQQGSGDNRTAYLMEQVANELDEFGISADQLTENGYEIHTSIDRKMQAAAYETMKLPDDVGDDTDTRASLTSIDPKTGEIKAMYGGPDYSIHQTNAATFAAQGASTFKPFTLIGALEKDIPLTKRYGAVDGTVIEGWNQEEGGPDVPLYNFDHDSWSSLDLTTATANSVNVVYGQLNKEIGPKTTAEVGYRLGIPQGDPEANECCVIGTNLANVLGTAYVTNVNLAHAYSTIAAQGYRTSPHMVVKVMDGERLVHEGSTAGEQVVDEEVTAAATYAMSKVVEEGSGKPALALERPAAGKTGSSNDNMSAWFAGFVPQLTTVVGLYDYNIKENRYEEIEPFGGYEQITGGSWPVEAWTDYMLKATEGMEVMELPEYTPPEPPEPSQSPSPTQSPSQEPDEEKVTVPTGLTGEQYTTAASALAGVGLIPQQVDVDSDQPAGTVLSVDGEGQEVDSGSTIRVEVSNGSQVEQETTTVPWGLTNQDQGHAEEQVSAAGLEPVVQEAPSDSVPEGRVISVDPSEGSEVDKGSQVTLVVSSGPGEGGGDPTGDPTGDGEGGIFG